MAEIVGYLWNLGDEKDNRFMHTCMGYVLIFFA